MADELPEFPYEPRFAEVDGVRLAYVETGPADGPVVVLFHGEPTWSFLWRKVIPELEGRCRVIAHDMAGFGRSDKPEDLAWYSYDRHTALVGGLLGQLGVRDATFVVHDWGGPVGLRIAVEQPEMCARMVVLDTGLFTGYQPMTDAWKAFRDFVERTEDLPVGFLVDGAIKRDLAEEERAAYDWPFRDGPRTKAGARAFPLMLPTAPDAPGAEAGQRTLAALKEDTRPMRFLWADGDPIIPLKVGRRFAEALGRDPEADLEVIPDASHFLQEDQGELIGQRIAAWLSSLGVLRAA